MANDKLVPAGISARHLHLSREHVEVLFGKGYNLTILKELSQPGQFAANETVAVVGPKGKFDKVRILGPERKRTQVEVSAADARTLGVPMEVRNSGDIDGTPGVKLVGPAGSVEIECGVILAERHIHMHPTDAERFGVKNGDKVNVVVPGVRGGLLGNTSIRVHEEYKLDLHIDVDEANALLITQGQMLEISK